MPLMCLYRKTPSVLILMTESPNVGRDGRADNSSS